MDRQFAKMGLLRRLRYYFLRHEPESGDARYKLLPSKTDKDTFCALMDQAPIPSTPSEQMLSNFQFFQECLETYGDLSVIIEGLHRLLVVDIALNSREDNPQRIFESLNSTGLDLSQADLIRNFLLMGLPAPQQQALYQGYWWPMEALFGQKAYQERFDLFMRDYLTLHHPAGSIPVMRDIYTTFKDMMAQTNADSVVKSIHSTAVNYGKLALGQEPHPALREVFNNVAELVRVAYPFLLAVYADYEEDLLQADDVLTIARMVESYVFRRAIYGIAPNSLDKTFATFMREKGFDKTRYVESVKAIFLLHSAQRRFPSYAEFREAFMTRHIYKARLATYCLSKLEQHLGKKEPAEVLPENRTGVIATHQTRRIHMSRRKNYAPAFKAKVAQSALSGDKTIAELSSEFGVHRTLIHKWVKQLKEWAAGIFAVEIKTEEARKEKQLQVLHAKIGQITVERNFLAEA